MSLKFHLRLIFHKLAMNRKMQEVASSRVGALPNAMAYSPCTASVQHIGSMGQGEDA